MQLTNSYLHTFLFYECEDIFQKVILYDANDNDLH